jgi:DNA ligase 1
MPLLRRTCLMSLAVLACPAGVRAASPGVMLATDAAPGMDPRGWLVSEKLDGVRALWDGRVLRFRSGREIAAPAGFTRGLPARALDGELWLGRGRFEELSGLVRRQLPDDAGWRKLRYALFDLPGSGGPFAERASRLQGVVADARLAQLTALPQSMLPDAQALQRRLDAVLRAGGEGLMLHRADALWTPGRSDALRKLKPLQDAEAVVVGHEPGQGRHQGRLGALRVRLADGRVLRLGTGLSDAERENPPAIGSTVSFRYRGLTESGLPRFASYLRLRDDGF